MAYSTEDDLVKAFADTVGSRRTSLPRLQLCFEFMFMGGRTDVVGVSQRGTVHSFEAKLANWRKCLEQAYRCTSFSHYSYVVIPSSIVHRALSQETLFIERGVGLCSIDYDKITLHIRPRKQEPLQPWLTERAVIAASESSL